MWQNYAFISVYCTVPQQYKEKIEKKYFVEKVFAIGQISQIFAKKKKKSAEICFAKTSALKVHSFYLS